jgi:hypothetical protein
MRRKKSKAEALAEKAAARADSAIAASRRTYEIKLLEDGRAVVLCQCGKKVVSTQGPLCPGVRLTDYRMNCHSLTDVFDRCPQCNGTVTLHRYDIVYLLGYGSELEEVRRLDESYDRTVAALPPVDTPEYASQRYKLHEEYLTQHAEIFKSFWPSGNAHLTYEASMTDRPLCAIRPVRHSQPRTRP